MSSRVRLRVQKAMVGEQARSGAVAEFIPVDERGTSKRGVILPVGGWTEQDDAVVDVEPGTYVVQALLPSGSLMTQNVVVGADETKSVVFQAEQTPHEWLGWQGMVQRRAPVARPETTSGVNAQLVILQGQAPPSWRELRTCIATRLSPSVPQLVSALWATPSPTPFYLRAFDDERSASFMIEDVGLPLDRPHYVLIERGATIDLVCAPMPWMWRRPDGSEVRATLDLAMPRSREGHVGVAVQDPQLGALLGFIGGGRLPAARAMAAKPGTAAFRTVQEALLHKLNNPFAAAAGAYVLLQTDKSASAEWHPWVKNLADFFPWFPDGAALLGALRLQLAQTPADVDSAREAFEQAIDRGVPVFAPILRLLLDGVTTLVEDPDVEAGNLRDKLSDVRAVASVLATEQAVTTLHFGGRK